MLPGYNYGFEYLPYVSKTIFITGAENERLA